LCAARNRCPHLGFSLTKGPGGLKYAAGQVVCPWHNSSFDLATGENLDWTPGFAGKETPRWSHRMVALGRKPSPLTTYTSWSRATTSTSRSDPATGCGSERLKDEVAHGQPRGSGCEQRVPHQHA